MSIATQIINDARINRPEILFRAKRLDNGKWIEGYYYKMAETTYCFKEDYEKIPVPEHHFIVFTRMTDWGLPNQVCQVEIDPNTLCRFTGFYTKDKKRIWEFDICDREEPFPEIILWYNGDWTLDYSYACYHPSSKYARQYKSHTNYCNLGFYSERSRIKVIGNIFDNPELLQEAVKNE